MISKEKNDTRVSRLISILSWDKYELAEGVTYGVLKKSHGYTEKELDEICEQNPSRFKKVWVGPAPNGGRPTNRLKLEQSCIEESGDFFCDAINGKFSVEWSQMQRCFHINLADQAIFGQQLNEAKSRNLTDWKVIGIFETADQAHAYCDYLRKSFPSVFKRRNENLSQQ